MRETFDSEESAKAVKSGSSVLVLGTVLDGLRHDPGGEVFKPNGGVTFVAVLSSWT